MKVIKYGRWLIFIKKMKTKFKQIFKNELLRDYCIKIVFTYIPYISHPN